MRLIFLINCYQIIDKLKIFVKLLQIIYLRFLGRLPGLLLKTGLSFMKNLIKPLVNSSVLIPLGLTAAAASAADDGINKKY